MKTDRQLMDEAYEKNMQALREEQAAEREREDQARLRANKYRDDAFFAPRVDLTPAEQEIAEEIEEEIEEAEEKMIKNLVKEKHISRRSACDILRSQNILY